MNNNVLFVSVIMFCNKIISTLNGKNAGSVRIRVSQINIVVSHGNK